MMNFGKKEILKLINEELKSFEVTEEKEGSMARSQLYKLEKYASELQGMFDDYTDLPEWVEAKITKASDYIGIVKHYLETGEARKAGALEENIEREKLLQLAMGVLKSMDDTQLEDLINSAELNEKNNNLIKQELQNLFEKGNIIDEKLVDKIKRLFAKKGPEMPSLKSPKIKDRKAINIVPRPGQTDAELRAKADSDTPYQTAGEDVDLPTLKDKLEKSAEMRASMLVKKNKNSKPRVTAVMRDFKSRLAMADTIVQARKTEKMLNSELQDLDTDPSAPPEIKE